MKIALVSLSLLAITTMGACSNENKGISLYEKITTLYVAGDEYNVSDDFIIKRYLGNKDNIYAYTIAPNSFPLTGHVHKIHIGDYVSEKYYGDEEWIYIYENENLYHLQHAYDNQIIDLEFIKTFDTFRDNHSPEELKHIYQY